jgi:putative Ca2+/H+ antiporter (TMEM165/GDT1 family)
VLHSTALSALPLGQLAPLFTTFVLIFIAELGDKTLYTVLLLAARNPPLPVLVGACGAFVVQGGIALVLGSLLARLPHAVIGWITAVVFVGFGLLLLFGEEREDASAEVSKGSHTVIAASFLMVFIAEWGDATQIGTAALVAETGAPLQVFVGATLALWAGTALAVVLGRLAGKRLPVKLLRRVAGTLFVIFGVMSAIHAVRGS